VRGIISFPSDDNPPMICRLAFSLGVVHVTWVTLDGFDFGASGAVPEAIWTLTGDKDCFDRIGFLRDDTGFCQQSDHAATRRCLSEQRRSQSCWIRTSELHQACAARLPSEGAAVAECVAAIVAVAATKETNRRPGKD
jgi:hypothetical protein